eukprot:GDKH01016537.1.p1 GENE.GDKH01016537.1~~GDKH01016537.1.p1  ORF type:complete len:187 (+),score=16.52 GDKH01016537.1:150-710(+)
MSISSISRSQPFLLSSNISVGSFPVLPNGARAYNPGPDVQGFYATSGDDSTDSGRQMDPNTVATVPHDRTPAEAVSSAYDTFLVAEDAEGSVVSVVAATTPIAGRTALYSGVSAPVAETVRPVAMEASDALPPKLRSERACVNVAGWVDTEGADCVFYEAFVNLCSADRASSSGVSALDGCCVCSK